MQLGSTGPNDLTKDQSIAALQIVNMTKTHYLMGICPLYEGMAVLIDTVRTIPSWQNQLPEEVRTGHRRPLARCSRGAGGGSAHQLHIGRAVSEL